MEGLNLREAVVFLAAAGLVIPLFKHLRGSPVLGFLLVGLAVGPYGLARLTGSQPWLALVVIADLDGTRALAELGVVFLLFMIGLELSLERLWALRRLVFALGSAQILVTALVIGAVARLFDNSLQASVVLGASLALSSTAVVMQLLTEQGRFGTPVGRVSFSILLAQDLAVVPILFLVGSLGASGGQTVGAALALALGQAVVAVAAILGIGRVLVRPLFRFVAASRSPELFVAAVLLMIIATAAVTHAAGLSAALGAFLAGLLFAETEFRHEIEVNIEPFKGLLLGLFFMSVGMGIDLAVVLSEPAWMALSVAGLVLIKALVAGLLLCAFGASRGQAVEAGLLLGQGGEFGFVVVGLAMQLGLIPPPTAQFMLIVVGATMFLTPGLARGGRALGERLDASRGAQSPDLAAADDLAGHAVIVGFGRTGQLLARLLERQSIAYVALDLDPTRVGALRTTGAPVYMGDASREAMLERVRLRSAVLLAISMDDAGAAERVLQAARRLAPDLPVLVRARDDVHALRLLELGATEVVPEVLESGLQLGHQVLQHAGVPAEAAHELVATERIAALAALRPAASPGPGPGSAA